MKNVPVFLFFSCILMITSCIGYKKTLYFQGDQNEVTRPSSASTYVLQAGDILKVKLFTPDTKSAQMLDMDGQNSGQANPASIYMNNYSVSDSGFVDLPLAGSTYVLGYTVRQVDSIVTEKAKLFFNYSSIEVKLVSFKFMAVGEFRTPGYTYVYNDKCTIIEAISLAGDVTEYANKQKVVLIRQVPNKPDKIFHLDLTDYSYYNTEAFYMHPNDVIYIQPQKAKIDSKNIQFITLGFAAITTILLIINFTR